MRVAMLGSLEVQVEGDVVDLRSAAQRRALLFLALHVNEVVPTDQLLDAVWPSATPANPRHAVHSLIHRLRRQLDSPRIGDNPIRRHDPGYSLVLDRMSVDALEFSTLIAHARQAMRDHPDDARSMLVAALELWRGQPLLDVGYESWAAPEIRRLDELRISAFEALARLNIDAGHNELAIADLEWLSEIHPMRESLWVLLWEALAGAGRHLEVTDTYRRACRLLADGYGLEPSAHLRQLSQHFANGPGGAPSAGPSLA